MHKTQRIITALLCLLLVVSLFPASAQAATPIDVTREGSIGVSYTYQGAPVPGVTFSLYRVADVNASGKLTPSGIFASYPMDMVGLDQSGWEQLALTLAGYVQRDGLGAVARDVTDDNGAIRFSGPQLPGLYLLLGESVTVNGVTYTTTPAMVHLPGKQANTGEWNYAITVLPKCKATGEYVEPVTRKVLKVWNDNNDAAGSRPASITVDLLQDGQVYDTQILTAADNWRYTWEGLAGSAVWTVVERGVDNYTVKVEQEGVTFLITNTVIPDKYCEDDPPVKKIVKGNPPSDELFRFKLEAVSNTAGLATMPMPAGSDGQVKIKEVWGGGEYEFGIIRFTVPGTYIYRMSELKMGVDGYTYDDSVYTVTYVVTDDSASPTGMKVVRTITKDGQTVETAEFVNKYDPNGGPSPTPTTTPSTVTPTPTPDPGGPKLPKTGQLKWPIPVLLIAGACFVMAGLYRKKRDKDEYES